MTTTLPALMPQNLPEAMDLARMLATARNIPPSFKASPPDVLSAISLAHRWQMDSWAVMQHLSIISGRLMVDGQLAAAVINARAGLRQRLSYTYEGTGQDRTCTASGWLDGEDVARTVTIRLKDVKTENAAWMRQPDQQLAYTGARVWGRRHTPELLLGVVVQGEVFDLKSTDYREMPAIASPDTVAAAMVEVQAPAEGADDTPGQARLAPEPTTHEEARPKSGPQTVPVPEHADSGGEGGPNWQAWGQTFVKKVRSAQTSNEVDGWLSSNAESLSDMKEAVPRMHSSLSRSIQQYRLTLLGDDGELTQ